MSEPIAIERAERIATTAATLRTADGNSVFLVAVLRRLHNEVSSWLVELEEPMAPVQSEGRCA